MSNNKKVNSSELYVMVATQAEITKHTASQLVDTVFSVIMGQLQNGLTVSIRGFGTFTPVTTKFRNYRMPDAGPENKIIAGGNPIVKFKAAKKFKTKNDWE